MQIRLLFLLVFLATLVTSPTLVAQGTATATAGLPSESAYSNLNASGGATGFGIEAPDAGGDSDCTDDTRVGDHSDFGEHITHVAETELPGDNDNVFLFHSHIAEDSDRCGNIGSIDRIRTEIKGRNICRRTNILLHRR